MADFFPDVLDGFTEPFFLKKVRDKFHYEETQADELKKVAEEMLPLMRGEAFWERSVSFLPVPQGIVCEEVVMSLGIGIDALQDRYSSQEKLSRSYMLEVLASELLMLGYGAYNRYMEANTDMHVERYYFLGSEGSFPMEMLPNLLARTGGRVTCNKAFCMIPKKSVAFVAKLTRDGKIRCEGICVGCGNRHCANRVEEDSQAGRAARMPDLPLTYGYGRIFGKI
ncbi:MAG: hypothetical protein NC416_13625 [Eubacterium sp.]|nr:hypothetical protein [Eubacterium sp.]